MREIKFRVWDKHHKRMRYLGNNVHDDISFDKENRAMYFNLQCCDGGASTVEEDDERYGFSPLMQYTGLKDKNGKEIYEGDIVKRSEYLFANKYRDVFKKVWYSDDAEWMVGSSMLSIVYPECEVIGNTYETKRLPKKPRDYQNK